MKVIIGVRWVGLASAIILLIIALATRLYALGSFPHFPPVSPWNGAHVSQSSLQGLYSDEYNYLQSALGIIHTPRHLSLYQPPVALLFIGASVTALGVNVMAVRLPLAVFSSLTVVFVYLISKKLSNSNLLGIASGLFFIVMVPALVYGRMAFLENASAFFFVGMFYFLLKYKEAPDQRAKDRWLLVASFFAGFSVLSKITGIVSVLFLLLFVYRYRVLRRSIPLLLPALILLVAFPLIAFAVLDFNATRLASLIPKQYGLFLVGNEIGVWRYFFFETLPSGFTANWGGLGGFPIPEFWYIVLYVTLAAVAIKEFPTYSDLVLAISVFVAFDTVVARLGSYHLIYIQPLLAISFGPGIRKLLGMPIQVALGIFTFLYVPLAISLGVSVVTGTEAGNPFINSPLLFTWKFLLVLVPLAFLLISAARYEEERWRRACNFALIAMLLAVLLVASYLSPDLYSQYFYQKAFTP